MLIQEEFIGTDGIKRVKTYSNENRQIVKVGTTHIDNYFIDIYPVKFTYLETGEFIEPEEVIEDDNGHDDTNKQDNLQE